MDNKKLDKIQVKGKIHLGSEMKLVEKAETTASQASFFRVSDPAGIMAVHKKPSRAEPGELEKQRLIYSLEDMNENIFIEDDGLVTSYGIFGAPGTGKTYLLTHLLYQILSMNREDKETKYGGLIIDPKSALLEDVRMTVEKAGRKDDLIVINADELNDRSESVNVIDIEMNPIELGQQIVMAARSGGIETSDQYWTLAWQNLFGPATYLLSYQYYTITLKGLMDSILTVESNGKFNERRIQTIARRMKENLDSFPPYTQKDIKLAIEEIENYFRLESRTISTIDSIITSAYSQFRRSKYDCFSPEKCRVYDESRISFYDQIIDEGKIAIISASPSEPNLSKTLCTIVKCLFQRNVLSRLERVRQGRIKNFKRPLILACDEYSQIATELPGQSVGDGNFFSQSRQFGCMGIMVTQSVNVLEATSMKEAWKSVFSNFGAKIFLRLADNETAKEATELAGKYDWYITSEGSSMSSEGMSSSRQKDMREREMLPGYVLTQVFKKGHAVILGSLNGSSDESYVRFLHATKGFKPEDMDNISCKDNRSDVNWDNDSTLDKGDNKVCLEAQNRFLDLKRETRSKLRKLEKETIHQLMYQFKALEDIKSGSSKKERLNQIEEKMKQLQIILVGSNEKLNALINDGERKFQKELLEDHSELEYMKNLNDVIEKQRLLAEILLKDIKNALLNKMR
jgi:hypothetical protein